MYIQELLKRSKMEKYMKWRLISEEYPNGASWVQFLISDGKEVWVAREDKNELWFVSETNENEFDIMNRIKYWALLSDVPLPDNPEGSNYNEMD